MRTNIVLTLTGPDRVGIVEEVTRIMLDLGANVETSKMARLGGEFSILMLASIPVDAVDRVDSAFGPLVAQGYRATTSVTHAGTPSAPTAHVYRIEVQGADHEGIVYAISSLLSSLGINIESMETGVRSGAMSAVPLFFMVAIVAIPPHVVETDWIDAVARAGRQADVDVSIALAGA